MIDYGTLVHSLQAWRSGQRPASGPHASASGSFARAAAPAALVDEELYEAAGDTASHGVIDEGAPEVVEPQPTEPVDADTYDVSDDDTY
jgi:hypothetical protein